MKTEYFVMTLVCTNDDELASQLNLIACKEIISVSFLGYSPRTQRLYTVVYTL